MPLTPKEQEELDALLAIGAVPSHKVRDLRCRSILGPNAEELAAGELDLAGALQRARSGEPLSREEMIILRLGFLPEEAIPAEPELQPQPAAQGASEGSEPKVAATSIETPKQGPGTLSAPARRQVPVGSPDALAAIGRQGWMS